MLVFGMRVKLQSQEARLECRIRASSDFALLCGPPGAYCLGIVALPALSLPHLIHRQFIATCLNRASAN